MGPKFLAKVEEVKRLLTEAEGFYQSGRYDLAMKRYDQVLKLDPYNTAARRGQERIDNTKYRYGEEAYNETRGRAMWQLEHGWEQPVRQYGQAVGPVVEALQRDATGTARINNKLNSIIIPRVEFRDASIREAIDFVRQQAAANDPSPEGRRGVDIVLRLHSIGRSNEPTPVTGTTTAGEALASPAPTGALPPGESAPPPATANAQGPIAAIGDATITVATVQYAVVAGQTIVRRGGVAVPWSALKQGDSTVVKGAPAADGSLVAQTVDVYLLPRPFPEWVTIKAPIAVGADSITVLGQTFRVDAHTLIVRAGRTVVPLTNLRNGEAASVTGRPSLDNSLLASSINVGN